MSQRRFLCAVLRSYHEENPHAPRLAVLMPAAVLQCALAEIEECMQVRGPSGQTIAALTLRVAEQQEQGGRADASSSSHKEQVFANVIPEWTACREVDESTAKP